MSRYLSLWGNISHLTQQKVQAFNTLFSLQGGVGAFCQTVKATSLKTIWAKENRKTNQKDPRKQQWLSNVPCHVTILQDRAMQNCWLLLPPARVPMIHLFSAASALTAASWSLVQALSPSPKLAVSNLRWLSMGSHIRCPAYQITNFVIHNSSSITFTK